MRTSIENYTKKKQANKQTNKKRTDRTLGQMVKAKLHRQNHTQKHTHTHSQKEKKGKKYIYRCSQSPPPQFGMIRCLFRYSTDADTSNWLWSFNPLLLRLLGEISFSLFAQLLGFSFGFGPASVCRSPEGICSSLTQNGVKGAAVSGALAHSGRGREGYGCGVSLQQQRPPWRCTSLRHAVCSPGEVVPGSRDAGSGGLHRLPGGAVWRVTCARTQASWWWQQQP